MLEHQKIIIAHVANNKNLFEKEICKSMGWLNVDEQKELYKWLLSEYGDSHREIIQSVFSMKQAG